MLKEFKKLKVFVGLSGGVDSSVAAYLLKREGFDVVGVHLRCWNRNGCSAGEAEDARRVAERLGIPFYVLDLEREYKEKVVDYMIKGYASGFTPNPDVMCNKEIKFGLFLKKALEMGADYIATGHYVISSNRPSPKLPLGRPASALAVFRRSLPSTQSVECSDHARSLLGTRYGNGRLLYELYTARDINKDQSYFLWTLTQEQLRYCLFPIGDYLKSEVRAIAKKAGLLTADKKDSQGLCFVGKVTLKDFLGEYLPPSRGLVLDTAGNVLGEHNGTHFYTIGQRHGLGVAGRSPYYVSHKNAEKNIVVLAAGNSNPALYKSKISLSSVNLVAGYLPELPCRVLSRVRYRQPLHKTTLEQNKDGYQLVFEKPQKFVAAGQSAVLYSGHGLMLGGGVIV